jgi:tRNA threonylcarbamoyladenosine biosynthesis protein TsaB
MLMLSIDTSTRTGSAAILRDTNVLAEVSGYEETLYSNRLFRDVATLQERANFNLDQVDVFAVASGPGSFTGLRVGLTAVKAWAEVHGKPIAAISGLEAIAYESLADKAPEALSASFVAPFLDARRGQIFGALYKHLPGHETGLQLVTDESILSLGEFLEMIKEKASGSVVLVSPTPEVLPLARIEGVLPGQRVVTVSPALAPAIGKLGLERAKRGELVDALTLDANYVRRSDAEAAWKDR